MLCDDARAVPQGSLPRLRGRDREGHTQEVIEFGAPPPTPPPQAGEGASPSRRTAVPYRHAVSTSRIAAIRREDFMARAKLKSAKLKSTRLKSTRLKLTSQS